MAFMAILSLACTKENPSERTPQQDQMATLQVNVSDVVTGVGATPAVGSHP